jgi:DNA-binding response OmpR family regulator
MEFSKGLKDKRILVVDDDPAHRAFLGRTLSDAGADVIEAENGREALRQFRALEPSLVLLDALMPELDGWQTCAQLQEKPSVPIIFLTALGRTQDIVRGLRLGAVDYVTKPFRKEVLLARVEAALRQADRLQAPTGRGVYRDDRLVVDLDARTLTVAGEPIALTPTEFRLLALLIRFTGEVVPFDQILRAVWGHGYEGATDSVHLYVWQLRQKLESDPKNPVYLLSVRGIGYQFAPELSLPTS